MSEEKPKHDSFEFRLYAQLDRLLALRAEVMGKPVSPYITNEKRIAHLDHQQQLFKSQLVAKNYSRESLIDFAAALQAVHAGTFNRTIEAIEMMNKLSIEIEQAEQFFTPEFAAETKKQVEAVVRTLLGKVGADARHTENRSMKADVFAWLDVHMIDFKSMDKAAEAIAKTVAPIAFRTARDWVGEWKKLRSASTP